MIFSALDSYNDGKRNGTGSREGGWVELNVYIPKAIEPNVYQALLKWIAGR